MTSGAKDINSVTLLADEAGNFHAFWIQPYITPSITTTVATNRSQQAIYYTQLQGDTWLQPITILNSSVKSVAQLSVTFDGTGDLLLVWNEADTGDIMFSWANAGVANISSEWSDPVLIPSLRSENFSPYILAGVSGKIYVAYAIPLNEDRGIYLTQSNDNGETWSQPIQIFNGVTAGSQVVDQPKLAITSDGVLHVLWNQTSVLGKNNSPRLYYSRSLDGGLTWADPTVVVDGPTTWDQILGFGNFIQRIWQANENSQSILWLQTSTDGGLNWSQPVSFSNFGGNFSVPDLFGDNIRQPNLFFIANNQSANQVMNHILWDGKAWSQQQDLRFNNAAGDEITALNAAATSTGKLGVLYGIKTVDETTGQSVVSLNFAQRDVRLPTLPSTKPESTIVPAPTPTITTTEALVVAPTPTPIFLPNNLDNVPSQSGFLSNSWAGAILGSVTVLLIVGSAFIAMIRFSKLKRR